MADNQENKGQQFLTRSFLKNESINQKDNSVLLQKNLSKNANAINSLSKQMIALNENLVKMSKPTQQKKDFVRRDDPMLKLYKSVDDLEELMRENNNLQKQKNKGGLLDWIGPIMGLGGLLGFFLTGKKEMLFSAIKGLTKYSPFKFLLSGLDEVIKKISPKLFGGIGKIFSGIGDMVLKIPGVKNVVKFADNLIKPVMGMFNGIGKVFEPLGKLFGKGLAKEAGEQGAKGLGKTFLKKIPIIGSLIGLFFGIQRFRKGDWFGGLLEVASGLTSLIPIPGVGTALGIAVDAFLLFRDFAGPEKLTPNLGGVTQVGKKVGIEVLKSLPGIGTFIHFKEAMNLWGTDKLGAMKEIALGLTSVVPGANLILDPVLSFIEGFIKDKGGIGKVAKNVLSTAKSVITNPIGSVGKLFSSGKSAVGGAISGTKASIGGAIQSVKDLPGKIAESALSSSMNLYSGSQEFLASAKGGIDSKNINTSGMVPRVWQNFENMASEYSSMTGKDIKVNSAYRSITKQQELFDAAVKKYGPEKARKYVAPPGKSMHNYGYAIDINSSDGNFLESKNLLKKYGFDRPMSHEPWHIEPIGLKQKYAEVREGTYGDSPEGVGDAYSIRTDAIANLPSSIIGSKQDKVRREKLELSDSTIQALAQAMGTSFRGAIPKGKANQVSIDTNMRG